MMLAGAEDILMACFCDAGRKAIGEKMNAMPLKDWDGKDPIIWTVSTNFSEYAKDMTEAGLYQV